MSRFEQAKFKLISISIELIKYIIENGFIGIENYWEKEDYFYSSHIYDYYKTGIRFIADGKSPRQLSLLMELEKMKYLDWKEVDTEELQLMTIIEHILPCIQEINLDLFIDLCYCLIPKEKFNLIYNSVQELKSSKLV